MNRRMFLTFSTVACAALGAGMIPSREVQAHDAPDPIVVTLGRYPASPNLPEWQHGKEAAVVTANAPLAIARAKLKWRAMIKSHA